MQKPAQSPGPHQKSKLPIWAIYLLIAGLAGLLLSFKVPALNAPDEAYHFQRTFSLSELVLLPNETTTLPRAVLEFPAQQKLNAQDRLPHAFYQLNSSPLMYLPQFLGVSAARLFTNNISLIFTAGRLSNLFFWLGITSLAIRLIPTLKLSLAGFLLLPMALFLAATYSYDSISNSLAILTFALILHHRFNPDSVFKTRGYLVMGLLFFLIGQTGKTNLLLALLLVIVPTERFGTKQKKILAVLGFLAITWVSMASWQWIVEQQLGRQMVLHNPHNLDPIVQIKAILAKPWSVISIILTSIRMNYLYYFQTLVGVFGRLSQYLPAWFYWLWGLGFILLVAGDSLYPNRIGAWERVLSMLIGIVSVAMVFIALYILYTPLEEAWAWGVQGRYFIPLIPLFILAIARQHAPTRLSRGVAYLGFGLLCACLGLNLLHFL